MPAAGVASLHELDLSHNSAQLLEDAEGKRALLAAVRGGPLRHLKIDVGSRSAALADASLALDVGAGELTLARRGLQARDMDTLAAWLEHCLLLDPELLRAVDCSNNPQLVAEPEPGPAAGVEPRAWAAEASWLALVDVLGRSNLAALKLTATGMGPRALVSDLPCIIRRRGW